MPFSKSPDELLDTPGISTSFPVLSRTRGLVIHVLRTRAPLSTPKGFSFDLHVLGPPQTFALSQDQTLQFDLIGFMPLGLLLAQGQEDFRFRPLPRKRGLGSWVVVHC